MNHHLASVSGFLAWWWPKAAERASRGSGPAPAPGPGQDQRCQWRARTVPLALTWALGHLLVFAYEAAEDTSALDPFPGETGHGVVGPGRAELAAAVGSLSVVGPGVLGHHGAQVSFAEDQNASVTSVQAVSTNRSA